MKKITFILILFCGILESCGFRHLKNSDEESGSNSEMSGQSGLSTSVYYATIEKKILAPKCLKCHSDSGGNQGGVNLENYQETMKHLGGINQRSIIEKNMPPGRPLSNEEKNILGSWIAKGAPLDESGSGTVVLDQTSNSSSILWPQIQNEIISNRCIQCHSPPTLDPNSDTISTMEAGLDLTKISVVKEKADLIFKRVVISNDMPLRPYPPLSDYEKKLLTDWMIAGMPDVPTTETIPSESEPKI